jgi:hypothetical protein
MELQDKALISQGLAFDQHLKIFFSEHHMAFSWTIPRTVSDEFLIHFNDQLPLLIIDLLGLHYF